MDSSRDKPIRYDSLPPYGPLTPEGEPGEWDRLDAALRDFRRVIRRDLADPLLRWIDRHKVLAVLIVAAWVTAIVVAAIVGGPGPGWK